MSSLEESQQTPTQVEESYEDLPKILILGKTQQGKSTFIK